MGLVALVVGWWPPRGNLTFYVTRAWSRGLLAAAGVDLKVAKAYRTQSPAVIVANHEGLFDIPALLASLPVQTRFMAKRSLFHIPIFGWALRIAGFIPVDRGDRSRAKEVVRMAAERMQAGASIVVFPEATRSLEDRLLPFKPGALLVARRARAPIVPAGIRGSREILRRGSFLVRPGIIEIRYGDAVTSESGSSSPSGAGKAGDRSELLAELERRVADLARTQPPEEPAGASLDAAD